jgi:hypothetical protein
VILSEKATHVCYFWVAIGASDYRNDPAAVLGCVTENVAYADKLHRLTTLDPSPQANNCNSDTSGIQHNFHRLHSTPLVLVVGL